MTAAEQLVVDYLEQVWAAGRPDLAGDFIADEYDLGALGTGPTAAARNVTAFRTAFPDLQIEVSDAIAADDRVAVWMRLSGTHQGVFRGYPGSGRRAVWDEVGFFTVRDDPAVGR